MFVRTGAWFTTTSTSSKYRGFKHPAVIDEQRQSNADARSAGRREGPP
jgi:hypothetical protein